MVWSRDTEAERPPLSLILPRLYLGAERDVTQDRLSSLGISYVLSVSRCSPQPAFLPPSRYLRVPIDDSLWDDLLPWIPQALHFIDAAVSSGGSVLVHCAAGISRSPALAVAYIMYTLGMDLDRAYRFVKERRPSISPNFNFLGQLQHFQASLSQKACGGDLVGQQPDGRPPSIKDGADHAHTRNTRGDSENSYGAERGTQRRHGAGEPQVSGKLLALHLILNPIQRHVPAPSPREPSPREPSPREPSPREPSPPAAEPARPRPPAASASVLEKRKRLSLRLTPVTLAPPAPGGPAASPAADGGATAQINTGCPGLHMAEDASGEQSPPHSRCGPAEGKGHGLLSPFSITLNKLLGWGERVLLGGVCVQPALPYRCLLCLFVSACLLY
uniref:protein-tyrosine-phosphatase n=2 Tax=Gasterosteus aculeatus aculeatus TaxID=481459 RepID=A0AAQ4Q1A5_GASAC